MYDTRKRERKKAIRTGINEKRRTRQNGDTQKAAKKLTAEMRRERRRVTRLLHKVGALCSRFGVNLVTLERRRGGKTNAHHKMLAFFVPWNIRGNLALRGEQYY